MTNAATGGKTEAEYRAGSVMLWAGLDLLNCISPETLQNYKTLFFLIYKYLVARLIF